MCVAPGDYTALTNITVTIAAGEMMNCSTVMVVNDTLLEEDETFTIMLTSSDTGVNLGNNQTTITIIDDDCKRFLTITHVDISLWISCTW